MSNLIGKEVSYFNEKFTINEIINFNNIHLAYLSNDSFKTILNLNILRIDNKFADELLEKLT